MYQLAEVAISTLAQVDYYCSTSSTHISPCPLDFSGLSKSNLRQRDYRYEQSFQ
jgi:hypothetical protein